MAEISKRLIEAGGFRKGRDPERYLKSLEIDVKDRKFVDVLCQMDSLLEVLHKLCQSFSLYTSSIYSMLRFN